jgi:hypothetical protein
VTIAYRPAEVRDRDFIVTNWETSYQDAHTAGIIRMESWAAVMRREVTAYLDRSYAKTVVAYNPDAVGTLAELHGFISGEPDEKPPLVYYVYVSQPFRKGGIARRLFAEIGVDPKKPFLYLCSTPILSPHSRDGGPALLEKIPLAKWKPLRARYSREARKPYR